MHPLFEQPFQDEIRKTNVDEEETLTHFHENNEKFELFLSGYFRMQEILLPNDVINIIGYFSRPISDRSKNYIGATHFLTNVIYSFMTDPENVCEYCTNDDQLNILDFIFIRGGALRDCVLLREIKDIDLAIDIYGLNRAFLKHLEKYHDVYNDKNTSDIEMETKFKSKCIFWRHYTKKFSLCDKFMYVSHRNTLSDHLPRKKTDDYSYDRTNNQLLFEKLFGWEDYIVHCNYILNSKFILFEILEPLFKYYSNGVILDGIQHRIGTKYTEKKGAVVTPWTGIFTGDGKYGYGSYTIMRGYGYTSENCGLQYGQALHQRHEQLQLQQQELEREQSKSSNYNIPNWFDEYKSHMIKEKNDDKTKHGFDRYKFIGQANVYYSIKTIFHSRQYLFTIHGFGNSGHKYNINFDIVDRCGNSYNILYQRYKHLSSDEQKIMLNNLSKYHNFESIENTIDNYDNSLHDLKDFMIEQYRRLARNGIKFKKNPWATYDDPFDPTEGYESPPPDSDDDEKKIFSVDDRLTQYRYELRQKAKRMKKDYNICLNEQLKISSLKKIDIPLYQIKWVYNVKSVDFTINSMHIDLTSVLMIENCIYPIDSKNKYNCDMFNGNYNQLSKHRFIDYNWEDKVKAICNRYNRKINTNKKIENAFDISDHNDNNNDNEHKDIDIDGIDVICHYNMQGLKDLSNKMLISPDYKILTHGTSKFYFWRLLKTCEKFIDKMDNKHKSNIWQIDKRHLKQIQKNYQLWLNPDQNTFIDNYKKHINSCGRSRHGRGGRGRGRGYSVEDVFPTRFEGTRGGFRGTFVTWTRNWVSAVGRRHKARSRGRGTTTSRRIRRRGGGRGRGIGIGRSVRRGRGRGIRRGTRRGRRPVTLSEHGRENQSEKESENSRPSIHLINYIGAPGLDGEIETLTSSSHPPSSPAPSPPRAAPAQAGGDSILSPAIEDGRDGNDTHDSELDNQMENQSANGDEKSNNDRNTAHNSGDVSCDSDTENDDDQDHMLIIHMFSEKQMIENHSFLKKLLSWNIQDKFHLDKYKKYDYNYYCQLIYHSETQIISKKYLNKFDWYEIDYDQGYTIIKIDNNNNMWYNRFKVLRYLGFEKEFKKQLCNNKEFARRFNQRINEKHKNFHPELSKRILPNHAKFQLELCLQAFDYPINEIGIKICNDNTMPRELKYASELAAEDVQKHKLGYKTALHQYLDEHNYMIREKRLLYNRWLNKYVYEYVNTWQKPSWLVTKSWKQCNQWLLSYWYLKYNKEKYICLKKQLNKKKKHGENGLRYNKKANNAYVSYSQRKNCIDKKTNDGRSKKGKNVTKNCYLKWVCKCGVDEWNQENLYFC